MQYSECASSDFCLASYDGPTTGCVCPESLPKCPTKLIGSTTAIGSLARCQVTLGFNSAPHPPLQNASHLVMYWYNMFTKSTMDANFLPPLCSLRLAQLLSFVLPRVALLLWAANALWTDLDAR